MLNRHAQKLNLVPIMSIIKNEVIKHIQMLCSFLFLLQNSFLLLFQVNSGTGEKHKVEERQEKNLANDTINT